MQQLSPRKRDLVSQLLRKQGIRIGEKSGIETFPDGPAPLSFVQTRLWFHEQLHPGTALYNAPVVAELRGELDQIRFEHAFNSIVKRHTVLRSVFRLIDGEPKQIVTPYRFQQLQLFDLGIYDEITAEAEAQRIADYEVRQTVDLEAGPVFYGKLIKLTDRRWWLVVVNHHIVFDGVSRPIFLNELAKLYAKGQADSNNLVPLPIQYRDFAAWQRSGAGEERLKESVAWWMEQLKGAPTYLSLPTDRPRPAIQAFNGNTVPFSISADDVNALKKRARSLGVTEFSLLATTLNIVLFVLTGQRDMVICSGVAARQPKQVEQLLGCFINVILLRTQINPSDTASEYIQQVAAVCADAFAHQDVPFERLVTALSPERDLSYNPLAQVMIVYHNEDIQLENIGQCTVKQIPTERLIAQYDLLFRLTPEGDTIKGRLEYNVDLFDHKTVERYVEQFEHVLHLISSANDLRVSNAAALPPSQVQEILAFNPAESPFPDEPIHLLIERMVEQQPDAIAVRTLGADISYASLNSMANQLAKALRSKGVRRGDIVAISLDRGIEMVVALIAIVKAGGAYLPIDPSYPVDRVRYLVSDSKTSTVVTHTSLRERFLLGGTCANLVFVDDEALSPEEFTPNLGLPSASTNLLYLTYTSGSTGAPKGVMLDHRGRVNNFNDFNNRFGVGPGDGLLAVAPLSFDMCAYDVFGTLMCGATIVMACNGAAPDPDEWAQLLSKFSPTVWHSPPALLGRLLESFSSGAIPSAPSLRLVLLGGDWIPLAMPSEVRRFATDSTTVVSMGGATEVSMDSTIYVVDEVNPRWSSIPYGVAMANQSAFVLNESMQLAPIGVAGELFLGGVGVGWGYFRRPALTATRFLPNPYSEMPGDRIYRTGDIARWTNEGQLELLGRADFQVKINGVRIELGEIDAAVAALPDVQACVTTLFRPKVGAPTLVSYVVPSTAKFNPEKLQSALFERLPAYMVPRQYVALDALPLSSNGKVLRSALPEPAMVSLRSTRIVPAVTIMERTLFEVWSAALHRTDFGTDDDFFDLGGTSLQAALVVNRLPKRLSLVEFMRNPTIAAQAKLLNTDGRRSEGRLFRFPVSQKTGTTVLCAPYAGGSPIIFRKLATYLSDRASTIVVCMPSPEECEAGKLSIETIASEAIDGLTESESESCNLILYGHCAGTAITAEIARQLEERGIAASRVILAAAMPPGVPTPYAMPRETHQEIVDFVASLGGTEESAQSSDWDVMVKEFQRDSQMVRRHYSNLLAKPRVQFQSPLTVIIATDDPLTEGHADYAALWKHVAADHQIEKISGGHYFVSTAAEAVVDIISPKSMPI
ncbi:amino acid adenylation domain-containing protein [Verminephrobacter aporrectodeae subsp. tuberculatae]|uniref:amino acid adenylation domain-containing protein n=1 Tax=Verminephrobacter aporrectodeae TaxID=1110389 RepID=UPI002244DA5B|nr:amino acid adenylation domain-containing protein [Verminephrobacter aporrectodeae]MCW8207776.1 amino acid adenylation domain-containing protein [Verminephrobacter aporrectodeae subsp. tuberculatae]